MSRDRRLRDSELRRHDVGHLASRMLPVGEELQNPPPDGVTEDIESVHSFFISSYSNIGNDQNCGDAERQLSAGRIRGIHLANEASLRTIRVVAMPTPREIVEHKPNAPPPGESSFLPDKEPQPGVEVVPYDPGWPQAYRLLEERVRATLGDRVLAVGHVGSTAVPGLAAKPVIDLTLIVADSEDLAQYQEAKLAAAEAAHAENEHVMQYNARKEQVIREIYDRAFRAAGFL